MNFKSLQIEKCQTGSQGLASLAGLLTFCGGYGHFSTLLLNFFVHKKKLLSFNADSC